MSVKAKKHLGQHFLTSESIAENIVESLDFIEGETLLEVGPGTGVLTKYLIKKNQDLLLAEIDEESITYLKQNYLNLSESHFIGDFLKYNFAETNSQIAVIGNFPYNISSQILFKIIENFQQVPQMVGMFQKEVAERVAAVPRTKDYGILSVLVQAYYDTEYLFTVNEDVFDPPPKVKSGVIKLRRNVTEGLVGKEALFKKIVKAGFGQRRKKLSNSLKVIGIPENLLEHRFMTQRVEELSVKDFLELTHLWEN
ncbi:16S rRNA (adenine(1518)-N(6)/adenine(1519)-N(6))-dimethyltransferase RsmA [Halpernia frigidisoli]|uniref:Ribosomal RNA small subunit methyltransferase A n=1 Tax=Halpernia frigidisoli TaxID=1125876 RepID=A0A1I3E121_9FLAO|nr:16S rRNA (adenine(1518)-N(6)/adenine(1519)-N(6))-dimethyltransferase RsmA [Halpernia frigidisoli]SFH92645.1 16S rRNA (adenine1518-N6/adenine1519-N6)-dimethyltransferase [Halpernia frigidisoli]